MIAAVLGSRSLGMGAASVAVERQAQRADGGEAAVTSPRSVTRGESNTPHLTQQRAKVDWLNVTFPGPDRYTPRGLMGLLSKLFKRPISGVEGRGVFGFDRSIKLVAHVGSGQFPMGCIAWGGEQQQGRWMLQITGAGCQVVGNWLRLAKLLRALGARITRLDLCVDYLDGQYSVDDAVAMYRAGEFSCAGRPPSSACAGDWLDKAAGRTLYIGKAVNGKMLRVYEKGMQLGDSDSPWVRFEVQLGNRDRVIPFEALTRRDEFLAGCYPALEKMLAVAAESIPTNQTEGKVSLSHLMFHLKRSYGKLLNTVSEALAVESGELIEAVTVYGVPRRLHPSAVASKLTWAQLLAQLRK